MIKGVHETLDISYDVLLSTVNKLRREDPSLMLEDIVYQNKELLYFFTSFEYSKVIAIRICEPVDQDIVSLDAVYKNASMLEFKVHSKFGVKFTKLNDVLHMRLNDFYLSTPFDIGIDQSKLVDGEDIYCQKCFSKLLDYAFQITSVVKDYHLSHVSVESGFNYYDYDRLMIGKKARDLYKFGQASQIAYPHSLNILIKRTLELIGDHEVTWREQSLRVFKLEVERILYNLDVLLSVFDYFKTSFLYTKTIAVRKLFYDFYLEVMNNDVYENFSLLKLITFFDDLELNIESIREELASKKLWRDLLRARSISKDMAFNSMFKGVNLRASGINFDIRKRFPCYFYDELQFNVPMGVEGSCYERLLLRIYESLESVKILKQLLEKIPPVDPNYSELDLRSLSGEARLSLELPNGEVALYLKISNGIVDNANFTFPSKNTLNAIPELLEGVDEDTIGAIIKSLNIVGAEVDN